MLLITGHIGFIGHHLVNRLEAEGKPWIGYDLEYNNCDIRDKYKLNDVFRKNYIDTVIHLAARAGVKNGELFPDEYITTNIIGTKNVIDCVERYNIRHFIFFSSSSIFGEQCQPPFNEEVPASPISLYGLSKLVGEIMTKNSKIQKVTIIRPFTVYGEDGRKDQVIYRWLEQIKNNQPITFYGDGHSERGYTYVEDLIDGIIAVLIKEQENKCEIYNLGGQEIVTLHRLFNIFKSVLFNFDIKIDYQPVPFGDVLRNYADIAKAKDKLGYNPQAQFENKVKEIILKNLSNF